MKRLKNWLNKWRTQEPEKSYIRPITGEVEVTRREFLMEQLEERIVLHSPGPSDPGYEPIEFDGEVWYEANVVTWGSPVGDGFKYSPCGNHNEIIYGSYGDDIIDCSGSDCRYIIVGADGADTIIGGNGDDTIFGWAPGEDGLDTKYGGWILSTRDDLSQNGKPYQVLIGGGGADRIYGGPADDIICGDFLEGAGVFNDYLSGLAGDDILFGDCQIGHGSGSDRLNGGTGNDTLFGDAESGSGSGSDSLNGGTGSDFLYGDVMTGDGWGSDLLEGGDGADQLFGDTQYGEGYGADEIWGGNDNDILYGDSFSGDGSGCDSLHGQDGDDIVYGDSHFGNGSGADEIHGGTGNDRLVGDSEEGIGSGHDILEGGSGHDTIFGDSVEGPGSGDDRISGGSGEDILVGDSEKNTGNGDDIILGGAGDDRLFADSEKGEGSGNDILAGESGDDYVDAGNSVPGRESDYDIFINRDGDSIIGVNQADDVVVGGETAGTTYSMEVNGYLGNFREDPETGQIMVYNNDFGTWDPLGERYWDQERKAWVEHTSRYITVQYATRTMQYDNYGSEVRILENGQWADYNADDHYVVDLQEDPESGMLLGFNNDLGTWAPFMEEYVPDGADYSLLNEGDFMWVTYGDGTVLYLENYGDGAWISNEGTGWNFVELPGNPVYWDVSTGVWWSHAFETWSYSTDGGATWNEVPRVELHLGELDDPGSGQQVGVFDGTGWELQSVKLQFIDTDYRQTGLHDMDEFYPDLHDGIGYDGGPLKVTSRYWTDQPGDVDMDPLLDHVALRGSSGAKADPPPYAEITSWDVWIWDQWNDELLVYYNNSNPSEGWRPPDIDYDDWSGAAGSGAQKDQPPVTVAFVSYDDLLTFNIAQPASMTYAQYQKEIQKAKDLVFFYLFECAEEDVLFVPFYKDNFSLDDLVLKSQTLSAERNQPINTVILMQHGEVAELKVGTDKIDIWNFYANDAHYADQFRMLGEVMTPQWFAKQNKPSPYEEPAQIQLYTCNLAGYNTFAPGADSFTVVDQYGTIVGHNPQAVASGGARSMLTTIADLTDTIVFASSDSTVVDYDEHNGRVRGMKDGCLEFGVSPGGIQVDYEDMDAKFCDVFTGQSFQDFDTDTPYTTKEPKVGKVGTRGEPGGQGWIDLGQFYTNVAPLGFSEFWNCLKWRTEFNRKHGL